MGAAAASAPKVMKLYCGGSLGLSRVISMRRRSSWMGPGSRSLRMLPAQNIHSPHLNVIPAAAATEVKTRDLETLKIYSDPAQEGQGVLGGRHAPVMAAVSMWSSAKRSTT